MNLLNRIKNKFSREKPDAEIESTGLIDNKLPVCIFFDNVLLEKPSELKVRSYTIEGVPAMRHIIYDGVKIKYTYDMPASYPEKAVHKEVVGNRYVKEKRGEFIHYDLYQDSKFLISLIAYRN